MVLEELIKSIGLSELINCILVDGDIRNAMYIQSADYKEKNFSDPITQGKLSEISKHFPSLKQSNLDYGTLISKKEYTKKNVNTHLKMGDILGYPCSTDYQYTLSHGNEEKTYTMTILVNFTDDSNIEPIQVITNVCKDETNYPIMEQLAKDAEKLLKSNKIIGSVIESVVAEKSVNIPASSLIEKILSNTLNHDEISELRNIIYNCDFPEELQEYDYEYNNPVHQGILVTLVSYYMNDPLKPFFPLQKYPDESNEIDIIMEDWQTDLIDILNKSKGKKGGKRLTRKRKSRLANSSKK